MTKYQVCYGEGKGWEDVEDEERMESVLSKWYDPISIALQEIEDGYTVATPFSAYRRTPVEA